jgi:hypothetical protein
MLLLLVVDADIRTAGLGVGMIVLAGDGAALVVVVVVVVVVGGPVVGLAMDTNGRGETTNGGGAVLLGGGATSGEAPADEGVDQNNVVVGRNEEGPAEAAVTRVVITVGPMVGSADEEAHAIGRRGEAVGFLLLFQAVAGGGGSSSFPIFRSSSSTLSSSSSSSSVSISMSSSSRSLEIIMPPRFIEEE